MGLDTRLVADATVLGSAFVSEEEFLVAEVTGYLFEGVFFGYLNQAEESCMGDFAAGFDVDDLGVGEADAFA